MSSMWIFCAVGHFHHILSSLSWVTASCKGTVFHPRSPISYLIRPVDGFWNKGLDQSDATNIFRYWYRGLISADLFILYKKPTAELRVPGLIPAGNKYMYLYILDWIVVPSLAVGACELFIYKNCKKSILPIKIGNFRQITTITCWH